MRATTMFTATSVLAFVLLLSSGYGNAAQEKAAALPAPAAKAAAPEPAAPPTPVVIPLGDIATRATEVSNLLGKLTASAAPSAQIETIAKTLPETSEKLDGQFAAMTKTLEGEPSLETLQTLQQQWQRHQVEATAWLNTLTQLATKLQDGLNQLAELQKTWNSTLASAQESKAPDPIRQQIDATLAAIAAAHAKLQTERTAVLNMQSRVAQEVTKCGTALAQIGQYQQKAVAGILVPDAEPIWDPELWGRSLQAFPDHVRKGAVANWAEIVAYVREPREGSALHTALFFVLALVFAAARRTIAGWEKTDAAESSGIFVFERPYSAALSMTLLVVTSPFFQMPRAVHLLLTILAVVPMLRVTRPMLSAAIAPALYGLCILFAVDTLRQSFQGMQVIGRVITVAETLGAIALLIGMRRRYRLIIAERAESSRLIVLKLGRILLIIVLLGAFFSGVFGYVSLMRILTPGILVGGILALASFAFLRVISGAVALAFRVWPLRLLQMVENHRELLVRRVHAVLVWVAIFGWTARYLDYLGLLDPAWASMKSVLTAKVERGTLAISLGSVVEFVLTVWLALLLSRFIRFVLQEDVYPRIDLAPGLSYAASSLLNYIIIALGFVAALGVLGVDFNKVGVLAGAFGVGIGFGLQSIVNNFVSGLILLFERPIHVGDTIEVGNLQGTVRRIGIRASVVHTGAGADIIVPNSQLVTDKVTNWTLSDRLRRVELLIGVNYGADPKKVIELLEEVGRAHPDVLPAPAPRALFMSYGDSSINFELRVWPRQFDLSGQVKSDLASAVYDAVNAAGMSFPFPQREVRLVRDSPPEASIDLPAPVAKSPDK
ncbi:MAG: mechanosensitive ion channel family protein [Candidatus Binatia bacterium]